MSKRYAIYFVPRDSSELGILGRCWLHRSSTVMHPVGDEEIPGVSRERLLRLLEDPRRYGFHGTLKPPFRMAEGRSAEELYRKAETFAAQRDSFAVPALKIASLGNFPALIPGGPCRELDALAADCVREFDSFRAPPTQEELIRRRSAGLTENQERYLRKWGYPYVMDEFRFHLTLTGRIGDDAEWRAVFDALVMPVEPACLAPISLDSVSIVEQESVESPFFLTRRFPFRRPS